MDFTSKADAAKKEVSEENSTAFGQFAQRTSLHGVGRIVETRKTFGKISWAALLVGFVIFLSVMLYNVFGSYLSNNIYIARKKIAVERMLFPGISFCPTTLLRLSGLSSPESLLVDGFFKSKIGKEHSIEVNNFRIFNLLSHNELHDGFDSVRKVSANADELFISKMNSSCRFGLNTECHFPEGFQEVPVSLFEGVCFKFNHNGTHTQVGEGSYYGMSVILFVNQSDTVPFCGFDEGSGVKLVIQSHDAFPFPLENGVLLKPGAYTRVMLQKQVYERLPPPYPSKCVNEGSLIYPGLYTPRSCKRSCFVLYAKEACGGTDAFVEYFTGEKRDPPLNMTELNCFYNKQIEAAWPVNARRCNCPLQCLEEKFLPTVSQSLWPAPADLPYYKKIFASALALNHTKMTDDYVYSNFLKVNIFFSELSYEQVKEIPEWTKQKLVSDIGGQMGIWIGASLFSVLELIIFLFYFIKSKLEIILLRQKVKEVTVIPISDYRDNL